MPLSWNEIKTRAVAFSNKWKDEESEDVEAKSLWDDFFNVFEFHVAGLVRLKMSTWTYGYGANGTFRIYKEKFSENRY